MSDYEPACGRNLPPGCFEGDPRAPWNQAEPDCCGDCCHLMESCDGYGVCELEFEDAYDEARPKAPWEAAQWALDWAVDHHRDVQEAACERFV